ncbi:MAG: S8 family serine peptidase [Bacteroidota bacterium]
MKKTITSIFLFLFVVNSIAAQEFNPKYLLNFASQEKSISLEREKKVSEFLNSSNYKKTLKLENGNTAVLFDVVDGRPQYISTHNLEARQTTGVEHVQSENGLNLPLYGKNMTIGVWDGGLVLNSHQEFQKRIKNKMGSEYSNHATHVSGTIAASGVNSQAKGMLPEVTIHSYYAFDNDLGPMAEEAANGLILSNHSYGLILGWRFDGDSWQWFGQENGEDNRFGSYTSKSRSLDKMTYNAPYYTIVWSAGNDRSDAGDGSRPADGPFNIIGPAAAAKNIITVGAITGFEEYEDPSSAEMSGFSSWGPTNDGRIKPDLVADGVGLLSPSSSGDEEYATLSGTSMSAPNVTGTLGLIQEYYRQSADTFMTAAQLKSLAIHTSREAGNAPGPDYKYGWGILNAIDAIKVLQGRNDNDTLFTQATLNNGEIHEYELIPDKSKLTATIVWTDVAGDVTDLGSSTPNLVNDLDLHLEDDAGNKYYPWSMNPENFGGSARKEINSLDNVEKIEFQVPNVRKYKLVVSHKGTLENDSQTYALSLTYSSANIDNNLVYWVNGDGDYQDSLNFSSNSGGDSEPIDLSTVSSLTIDENSFQEDGLLTLSSDVSLENIIFTSDTPLNLDLGGNTLTVNNAIHSTGENLKISNGKLIVNPDLNNDIYLDFDGSDNLTIELDNEGSYNIVSDINAAQLNVLNGEYLIQDKSLLFGGVNLNIDSKVKFNDNVIELSGLFFNSSQHTEFSENNWFLNDAIVSTEFPVTSIDIIETTGNNSFTGEFNFGKLISNSKTEIFNKFEVDSLILNNGADIIINNEDSLIVHKGIKLNGVDTKRLSGSNTAQLANLGFTFRSKLCLENLEISNIDFTSESVLNITSGGAISNSENVLELPCSELIFPDFTIPSNCVNSLIYLDNKSEGEFEESNWDFGNGLDLEGVNNVLNPVVWFTEAGQYEIKLTISNELQTEEFTRVIEINENNLNSVNIIENQQGLVASVSGAEYQWFKDGIAIEGETDRVLTVDDFESGIYNVAYFSSSEEGCQSMVSDAFEYIVTSNMKKIDSDIKLYPNPVNNILTVKNFENYEKFRIFDFQSKMVHADNIDMGSNDIELDVRNLESGLYFIELVGRKKSIKLKFLIE